MSRGEMAGSIFWLTRLLMLRKLRLDLGWKLQQTSENFDVWRAAVLVLLTPVYIAVAWGAYFAAKWVASFLVASQLDQTIMGVMATVLIFAVLWAVINATDD